MFGKLQFDSISEIFLSILLECDGTHFRAMFNIHFLSTHKAASVSDGIFNRPATVRS